MPVERGNAGVTQACSAWWLAGVLGARPPQGSRLPPQLGLWWDRPRQKDVSGQRGEESALILSRLAFSWPREVGRSSLVLGVSRVPHPGVGLSVGDCCGAREQVTLFV